MVKSTTRGANGSAGAARVFRMVGGRVRGTSPGSGAVSRAESARPEPAAAPGTDQIRERAYALWCEAGRPAGDGVHFWLQAERELTAGP